MNTNGIISFNRSFTAHTPIPFPVNNVNILAPFWADVDVTRGGTIFYRETTNYTLLNKTSVDIQNAISSTFFPTHLFIATWNATEYYGSNTDKVHTYVCLYKLWSNNYHNH